MFTRVARGLVVVVLSGVVLASGCRKAVPETPVAPQETIDPVREVELRVLDLDRHVAALVEAADQLPGDAQSHRELMSQYFGELAPVLETIYPGAPGGYVQQLNIIRASQRRLSDAGREVGHEPLVESGLRGAYRALTIIQGQYLTAEQSESIMEQLQARLSELDNVRGPMHRFVSAQAARLTADLTRQPAKAYGDKVRVQSSLRQPQGAQALPAEPSQQEGEQTPTPAEAAPAPEAQDQPQGDAQQDQPQGGDAAAQPAPAPAPTPAPAPADELNKD